MIFKILLISFLCLLLLLLFYPLRFLLDFSYSEGKGRGNVKLCPVFTLRRFAFTVFDTEEIEEKAEKKKRKKSKDKENKKKDKKAVEFEMKPLHEQILSIVELLGKMKRGTKRLRVKLNVGYGFPDPALTGEITGALYAILPPFFGDMKRCKWKIGLYPQWCPPSPVAGVKGDICMNMFGLLAAFAGMIPEIMKILPKKKKKTEVRYESASH